MLLLSSVSLTYIVINVWDKRIRTVKKAIIQANHAISTGVFYLDKAYRRVYTRYRTSMVLPIDWLYYER